MYYISKIILTDLRLIYNIYNYLQLQVNENKYKDISNIIYNICTRTVFYHKKIYFNTQ